MIGEIIAIGDELTTGRILNTTSCFAARELFVAGYEIHAIHTIGDQEELIGEMLQQAIERVDFVIVTGGLGSTSDDLTNEAVSRALERPSTFYPEIYGEIQNQSAENSAQEEAGNLEKIAWLPEGAEVLNIKARMAGYLLVHRNTPIFFLPGVPSQMKELLVEQVLPRLAAWPTNNRAHVRQRVFKVFGLGENQVNTRLRDIEKSDCYSIGYYPVKSEVHVSLTVLRHHAREAEELFAWAEQRIRAALTPYCYGTDNDTMASVVGTLLSRQNMTLATAESCTGGLIGSCITATPGSSEWYLGGAITYSNDLKEEITGVAHDLLLAHGAVSAPVAEQMAAGIVQRTGADMGVAVTGIAGPGGGSREKPVGTVYMGLAHKKHVQHRLFHFSGNRHQIQHMTAQTALDLVRRHVMGGENYGLIKP